MSTPPPTPPDITDAQIEAIAQRAAQVAFDRVYMEIGKSVVKRIIWLIGAATVATMAYLGGAGYLK